MTHPLSDIALSLAPYRGDSYVVFDLETTNKEYGSALVLENHVVMAAWKEHDQKVCDHYGNILECREFWDAIERSDVLVAHNAKFEAAWLLRLGYDPTDKLWYDTMLGEKVRAGNRRMLLNLGSVSERYGFKGKESRVDAQIKAGVCPSDIDRRYLRARCRRDVTTTEQVFRKQVRVLDKRGQLGVALTRSLFTPILAVYESTGMCLDAERVQIEYTKQVTERNLLKARLDEITGGINMNSPDQKAHFFYEKLAFPEPKDARGRVRRNKPSKQFPDGRPKTDKRTIEWLQSVAKTEEQMEFFATLGRYSKASSALSKNLEMFKGVVDEIPSRIFHGEFRQETTGTHRLSGRGRPLLFRQFPKPKSVQFQNMPRDYKRLFMSRDPDYYMTEADGAQLEFRVAAFLGQDAQAMTDIRNPDFDAHVTSASIMNELDYDEAFARYKAGDKAIKKLRQDAKPDTFKPLYGGTQGTEAQMLWYAEFQARYADLYAVQQEWVDEVITHKGELKTPWGMRFYWDFYMHPRSGVPMDSREHKSIGPAVFNYPVQSLATAEIIPIAAVFLYHRCKRAGIRMLWVNTVHDSVIAEVHKEDIDKYKELVRRAFTVDVYRYLYTVYKLRFNVPLGCEIKWGTHWSEGEELKFDVEPGGK